MEYLEVLAECSVAFGGFAAIYAALQGSSGGRGTLRAWATVVSGIGALVLCLVALLVGELDLEESTHWRLSSAIGLVLMIATIGSNVYLDRRFSAIGQPRQAPAALATAWTLQGMGILLLAANLVGWPSPPGLVAYATAATLLLVGAISGLLASFWLHAIAALEEGDRG